MDALERSIEHGATVVTIGPLTNLATLEAVRPAMLAGAAVVAMAGWVDPPAAGLPGWGPEKDWNVQWDTRAAATVMAAVLGRLADKVRRRFREQGTDKEQAALARVEDPPASPRHLEALAAAIDRQAGNDAGWREELEALVKEAGEGGVEVGSVVQSAWGDHNVQIAGVTGSTISINTPPKP